MKEHRPYYSCLKARHKSWNCRIRKKCTQDGCTKYHHGSLHLVRSSGANFHTNGAVGNKRNSQSCILLLMSIETNTTKEALITVFLDSGANISLITFTTADPLGLIGNEVQITVNKVGGKQESMTPKS